MSEDSQEFKLGHGELFARKQISDQLRRETIAGLKQLFAGVDRNLSPASEEEVEEIFTEAMRSSRPGYRTHR